MTPRVYDPASPVRIVDIDDESLKRYGRQWPWPRSQLAAFVNFLKSHGALAIGFDFLFAESDQMGIAELIRGQPREKALSLIADELEKNGTYDEVFANALGEAPAVLGTVLVNGSSQARIPQSEIDSRGTLPIKAGFAHAGDDPLLFLYGFDSSVPPIKILTDKAPGIGALNWVPDHDRVIRQVPLAFGFKDKIVPSLAAETLRLAQEEGASYFIKSSNASGETAFGAQTGIVAIRIGGVVVNTQPRGDVRIRFTKHDERRFIPAWKLIANEVEPSEIENKIIFIGSSAAALGDMVTTPLDASVPGVEMHAQLLEHILTGQSLVRPDIADGIELVAMIVLSLILMFVLPFLSSLLAAAIGGLGVAAMVGRKLVGVHPKGDPDRSGVPERRGRRRLPHGHAHALRPEAVARALRARGLRPLCLPRGRASARREPREAHPRRREPRAHGAFLRSALLHHSVGELRRAGPHALPQRVSVAADRCRDRAQRHDRQIYRRRHHGASGTRRSTIRSMRGMRRSPRSTCGRSSPS